MPRADIVDEEIKKLKESLLIKIMKLRDDGAISLDGYLTQNEEEWWYFHKKHFNK